MDTLTIVLSSVLLVLIAALAYCLERCRTSRLSGLRLAGTAALLSAGVAALVFLAAFLTTRL